MTDPVVGRYADWDTLKADCLVCTRCDLSRTRRQVVFGAGNRQARICLVGQGPAPADDRSGFPWTGPARSFLDKAFAQAGIDPLDVYITNVTRCLALDKHGKQRAPRKGEVKACLPWLNDELALLKPQLILVMGAPAAQALIDPDFRFDEHRGEWFTGPAGIPVMATYQPTYLTRLAEWDRPKAAQGWLDMVSDLRKMAEVLRRPSSTAAGFGPQNPA